MSEIPHIRGYTPNHPWYYKLGGQPIPFADIPPSPHITGLSDVGRLPKHGAHRQHKLSVALAKVEIVLTETQALYETLQARGMEAISDHDKKLAALMGEPQMALYDALARNYCYIVFLKSQKRNLCAVLNPTAEPAGQITLF